MTLTAYWHQSQYNKAGSALTFLIHPQCCISTLRYGICTVHTVLKPDICTLLCPAGFLCVISFVIILTCLLPIARGVPSWQVIAHCFLSRDKCKCKSTNGISQTIEQALSSTAKTENAQKIFYLNYNNSKRQIFMRTGRDMHARQNGFAKGVVDMDAI